MKAISFGQELLSQAAEEKGILTVYQLFGTLGMVVMSMENRMMDDSLSWYLAVWDGIGNLE